MNGSLIMRNQYALEMTWFGVSIQYQWRRLIGWDLTRWPTSFQKWARFLRCSHLLTNFKKWKTCSLGITRFFQRPGVCLKTSSWFNSICSRSKAASFWSQLLRMLNQLLWRIPKSYSKYSIKRCHYQGVLQRTWIRFSQKLLSLSRAISVTRF
jgi:hypothetical protein